MAKKRRQEMLLEIIASNEIDTQEELVDKLNSYGYNVTQATVSRDIRELGLNKVSGTTKRFKYAKTVQKTNDDEKLLGLFKVAVVDVEQAQNLVVIKTMSGNGGVIGFTIDTLKMPEVVGNVAGDDTVLVVTYDNDSAKSVVTKLKDLL